MLRGGMRNGIRRKAPLQQEEKLQRLQSTEASCAAAPSLLHEGTSQVFATPQNRQRNDAL